LLKHFTRNVQGQIFGIDDTLDEVEPFGDEFFAVVHDEDTTNVELDVVQFLTSLEEIERSTLGNEEDRFEFELTFNGEVFDLQVVFPIVGERLVEFLVFFGGDVLGVTSPDGLGLVEEFPFGGGLLDLLGLFGLLLFFALAFFFIGYFFDLGLVAFFTFGFFAFGLGFGLAFFFFYFFLLLLLDPQGNGVRDELRVLLDEILQTAFLQVLKLILLKEDLDLGTTVKGFTIDVFADGEGTTSGGFPDVLVVIVVFGSYDYTVTDQVRGVETDTELTDHADVSTGLKSLHEVLGTGTSDGTEVVYEIGFGHTDTGIDDCDGVVGFVGDDTNVQALGVGVELGLVGKTLIANLVQGIRGVGNHFSQEDFLVAVERVNDQAQQLIDFGLESKGLDLACRGSRSGSVNRFGHCCV